MFKRAKRDPLRGHPIEDPFFVEQTVLRGEYGPTDMHLMNLRAHRLRALRHTGITSLAHLRRKIRILPHQVKAAIRVLNTMQGRAILADEVGLGKTIEAGIIIKELISRGKAKSILIMTPAALAGQWQQEMWDKFGERFMKHDDPDFKGFNRHDRLVTSIDTAKSAQHYPDIIGREWDLVIIDEAHYLKNKKTQRYALADDIDARHALMLTATPIQNNLIELYNLINLIKPGLLGTLQNFEEEYVGDQQGRVLLHAKRLQRLLEQVMIRNRRSETGLKFPERKVETNRVEASKGEYELHSAVSQFIRTYKSFFESHLALMILEREVASSAPALSKTLGNMMEKQHDADVLMAMEELQHKADSIKRNAKVNLILDIATKTKDKIILFTQFRETQELLSRRLKQEGVSNVKYHGQLSAGRRKKALDEFRNDVQVLVCTDSGSEGLNLQFAHILINYDLPWNPMRVEQRIGRVHRIGQEHDSVIIVNLAVADTIEDYVLQVLYEKIRLFEVAIGEMDLILSDVNEAGGLEKRIMDAIMDSEEDDDVKDALAKVEGEVIKSKEHAAEIKQLDASVFQQFDLSTASDDVTIEDQTDMAMEVRSFLDGFLRVVGAEEVEDNGIFTAKLPRPMWKRMGGVHHYTADPDIFEEREGEVELLSLGTPLIANAMAVLEQDGNVGQVRTAEVDERATILYYRYYIETIRSELEAFVSVIVTDEGDIVDVREDLFEIQDGTTVRAPRPLDKSNWDNVLDKARYEVGSIVAPILQEKREEAADELRRTEKRLEAYFEKQKEELRQNESKLRRKLGEINSRLYFTEDGVRERKLELEREKIEKQLHEAVFKNNRSEEELDKELEERLTREREKNEPRLKIELISATRLIPHTEAVMASNAQEAVEAAA